MTRASESVNMDPRQRQLGTRVDSPDEMMLYPPLESPEGGGGSEVRRGLRFGNSDALWERLRLATGLLNAQLPASRGGAWGGPAGIKTG